MRTLARLAPFALALAAVPLIACGGAKPPAKDASSAPQPTTGSAATNRLPQQAPDSPTASAVHISDEILKACGISQPDAFFAFDSAHLRPEDGRVLDQVVTCFVSGALKGRTVKLVGHADPRGDSEYNLTLGQSRADSVAKYMNDKGLDKAKTASTSRGSMDATGGDEPGWARDRRVDVMLGQ